MDRVRLWLGVVFAFPVSLLTGLFYILPFWALKWHTLVGARKSSNVVDSPRGEGLVWHVNDAKAPKWLLKLWDGWAGHCVGSFVVIKYDPKTLSDKDASVLLNHELHHVHQMHTIGFFQPIMYALSMLTAWLAGEKAYEADHFEMAARRAAGQIVDKQSFAQGYIFNNKSK